MGKPILGRSLGGACTRGSQAVSRSATAFRSRTTPSITTMIPGGISNSRICFSNRKASRGSLARPSRTHLQIRQGCPPPNTRPTASASVVSCDLIPGHPHPRPRMQHGPVRAHGPCHGQHNQHSEKALQNRSQADPLPCRIQPTHCPKLVRLERQFGSEVSRAFAPLTVPDQLTASHRLTATPASAPGNTASPMPQSRHPAIPPAGFPVPPPCSAPIPREHPTPVAPAGYKSDPSAP